MESGPRPVAKKPLRRRWWFRLIAVCVFLYGVGVLLLIKDWYQTPAAVERIHARKVTMEMVEGKELPPYPPIEKMNRTVAGYDVNENGVRDDVEIEIHRRHADSPKIRAAQLQYAMALQSQLTDVFSKGTLVAALQETGRSLNCLNQVYELRRDGLPTDRPSYEWTSEEMALSNSYHKEHAALIDPLEKEVEELVKNSDLRRQVFERSYKFMTSYSGSGKPESCDLALLSERVSD